MIEIICHRLWVLYMGCGSYPELLDQVHVGPLVLLHAALRDAGHVRRQGAVDQHAQHVQHGGEQLTGRARDGHRRGGLDIHVGQMNTRTNTPIGRQTQSYRQREIDRHSHIDRQREIDRHIHIDRER